MITFSNLNVFSPVHEEIKIMDGKHPCIKINSDEVENLDISNSDTITKVCNFIIINKNKLTGEEKANLIFLKYRLNIQICEIKKDTTGVVAFFRYLFWPSLKAEKQRQMEYMLSLCDFIHHLRYSPKQDSPSPKSKETGKNETPEQEFLHFSPEDLDISYPPVEEDGSLQEVANQEGEEKIDLNSHSTKTNPEPSIRESTPTQAASISIDAPLLGNGPSIPIPPKAGFGPPIPKESRLASKLSPQELHIQREKKKLANKLKERSHPENFYVVTPHKEEAKLEKEKQNLESEIKTLLEILSKKQVNENAQGIIQDLISKKKKQVEIIDEDLKGTAMAIRPASLEFAEKMKNYTNEELKILIGMIYNGKKPGSDHAYYAYYKNNPSLVDKIVDEWNNLSTSESGQAFLIHAEGWKKYMAFTIFSVMQTLKKRMLPEKHIDYLKQPSYDIPPYKPAKTEATAPKRTVKIFEKIQGVCLMNLWQSS